MAKRKKKARKTTRRSSASGRRPRRKTTTRRKKTTRKRARANPGVVIGDRALELRYEGGEGKRRGSMRGPWVHKFEERDIEVIGRKDGSVLLKSKSGRPIWDIFEV